MELIINKTSHRSRSSYTKLALIFLIGLVFSLIPIFKTFADASIFKVTGAEITSISAEATADIVSFNDSTVFSKVTFHHINDEASYKIKILNSSSKDYTISAITDDNTNPYISYIYDAHNGLVVPAGTSFDFEVVAKYTTGVTDMNERVSTSTVKFFINFVGEEDAEEVDIKPVVPNTGANHISDKGGALSINLVVLAFCTLGLVVCAILAIRKHSKSSRIILAIAITASIVTIPTAVSAVVTEINVFSITTEYHLMDKLIVHHGDEDTIINYGTPLEDADIDEPEKPGHTFAGWEDEEGNLIDPAKPIREDTTIIPRFAAKQYTITFDTAGGSEIAPISLDYGETVNAPADPTRTGYTFAGWTPEIPTTMPAENITVVAQWTVNQYTITFDTDGGSTVAPITQDFGTSVTTPADPTKAGYTFAGWSPEVPSTMPAENTTITAQWNANQYTITFDTAGGSSIDPITQDFGTNVIAPANPTKAGYTFAGWTPEIPTTMPAENITVTAQWTVNQYTITFDTAGGSEIAPITQNYDTNVTAPADPTRTGYTFAGWTPEIPTTMPAENITVTAQWTVNQYTITFDTAGGSNIDPVTQDFGTNITAPADPIKAGYTFAGWSPEVPATMPAENITVTAQWTVNQYTITFDTAGGSEISPITQDYNTEVTAPANPTKAGYTFAGWTPEVPATMPAENITITAQWNANQITIHFDKNNDDATGTMEDLVFNYDAEQALPNNGFSREHYHFASWNTEADGSGTTYANEASAKNINTGGTTTLYAQWEADSFAITFNKNANDAAGNMPNQTVTYDTPTTLNTNTFTREHYAFNGWNTAPDGSGTSYEDAQDVTNIITENVTLYAQWAVTPYTIIFDKNAEDVTGEMANQSVPYGQTVNLTANAYSRESADFVGWNTKADGTGTTYANEAAVKNLVVSGEITLYAQWKGFINYQPNASDVEGTMGHQPVSDNANVTLLASNFSRTGHGFAGWNTEPDYSGTFYGPQETIVAPVGASKNGITLYAVWVASAGSLQDATTVGSVCNSLVAAPTDGTANLSSVSALTDSRDNNTYAIAKLADGKCWMIENLRLEAENTRTPEKQALAQGYGGQFIGLADTEPAWANNTTAANSLYYSDTQEGTASVDIGATDAGYRFPRYNHDNTNSRASNPTTNNAAMYSYGNYYTWAATIADTDAHTVNNQIIANTSICPSGWHLPTGGGAYASDSITGVNITGSPSTYREFYNLGYKIMDEVRTAYEDTPNTYQSYYSSATTNTAGDTATQAFRKYPNNFIYSGAIFNSLVNDRGNSGSYWSSATYDRRYVYIMNFNAARVIPGTVNSNKYGGMPARCVASSALVNFNKNATDATGEMAAQELLPGVATNLTANTFTREHYAFSGWNTAPDGSGTAYDDEASITVDSASPITLYAQWAVTPYTIVFDKNSEEATGEMASLSVPYGETISLTANAFTRESYYFNGWNTATDGSGTAYADKASVKNLAVDGEVTLYAHWVECPGGYVCYKPNGATADGTTENPSMGNQAVNRTATSIKLLASNFKNPIKGENSKKAGFAGWNTKADGTGTSYGPSETISIAAGQYAQEGLALYAMWVESAGDLQSWTGCSALGDGAVTALTDNRDNNTYAIAKLADGNCWMIENLRLADKDDSNNAVILSATNTNAPALPLTNVGGTTSNSLSPSLEISTNAWCTDRTADCNNVSRVYTGNTETPTANASSANHNIYSYGNYYNWYSATAGNNSSAGDICPAGWHLPYGGSGTGEKGGNTSGGFYYLGDQLGIINSSTASNTLRSYPNNFVLPGSLWGSAVSNKGIYAFYSTNTPTGVMMYSLRDTGSNVNFVGNNERATGLTARCVTSVTTISYDKNATDATGEMSKQEVWPSVATNLVANTFTRDHYAFSGWNTAPDGSGTAYADGDPITIGGTGPITLYAQWAVTPYTIVFDKNAADASGEMSNQSIPYGETVNLAANSYTRISSNFVGWNTKADGSGTTYADGAAVKNLTVSGEITLYAQWKGFINYLPNASDIEGTMGRQVVNDGTNVTLLASNFSRNGYGFAGWNTELDYSGAFYGPHETITAPAGASKNGIALYAIWVASAGSFQNTTEATSVCNSLVTAPTDGTADLRSVSALTDQRDNETYAIAKLADGKCWMIENLRLDNTAIGNTDGSLAQGYATSIEYGNFSGLADPEEPWTTPATPEIYTAANSLYSIDGSNNTINIGTTNATNRFPRYNNQNTAARSTDTTNTQNIYSYGNYYTWSAATANTTTEYSTTTSICPNGWQLPLGGTSTGNIEQGENDPANYVGGFSYLDRKIGGTGGYQSNVESSLRWRKYPNNYVLGGIVHDGKIWLRGSGSSWWTSAGANNSHALGLSLSATGIYPGTFNYGKVEGRNIRCVIGS